MDRIWAESQPDLLLWGAGNTTNFSAVSATAPTEMGSTKVQAAANEQLLLFSFQSRQSEGIVGETTRISVNSTKCIYKLRAVPAVLSPLPGGDANNHRSPGMKCA